MNGLLQRSKKYTPGSVLCWTAVLIGGFKMVQILTQLGDYLLDEEAVGRDWKEEGIRASAVASSIEKLYQLLGMELLYVAVFICVVAYGNEAIQWLVNKHPIFVGVISFIEGSYAFAPVLCVLQLVLSISDPGFLGAFIVGSLIFGLLTFKMPFNKKMYYYIFIQAYIAVIALYCFYEGMGRDPMNGSKLQYCDAIDNKLKNKLFQLARSEGITGDNVLVVEKGKPNAFALRTSKIKKIYFVESIFKLLTDREVLAVTRHEMGHIRNNDGKRLFIIQTFLPILMLPPRVAIMRSFEKSKFLLYIFAVASMLDRLLLVVASWIINPMARIPAERAADMYAFRRGTTTALGSSLKALTKNSNGGAFFDYNKLFGMNLSHPPIIERVKSARKFRSANPGKAQSNKL